MKKFIFIAAAFAASVACNKVESTDSTSKTSFKKGEVVTFTVSSPETKVTSTAVSGGIEFKWDESDEIKVSVSGEEPVNFTIKSLSEDKKTAEFTGTMPGSGDSFNVQYPVGDVDLATQDYSSSEPLPKNKMLFFKSGCTKGGAFSLDPQYAVLQVNLYGTDTRQITKAIVTVGSTSYTLNVSGFSLPSAQASAQPLYIVVPPFNDNFTIELKNGDSRIAWFETTTPQEIAVGKVVSMPAKEMPKVKTTVSSDSELSSALSGANNGDIIQLTQSITTNDSLRPSNNLTLDLNGKTLTSTHDGGSGDNRPFYVGKNVTVKNGTIVESNLKNDYPFFNVFANGHLTLDNVNMSVNEICVCTRESGASATINSGNYTSTADGSGVFVIFGTSSMVINGGSVTGAKCAIEICNSKGDCTINGGTLHKATIPKNLDRYNAEHTSTSKKDFYFSIVQDGDGTITIKNSAVVEGDICGRVNYDDYRKGALTYVKIEGGYFDNNCTLYNYDEDKVTITNTLGITKNWDAKTLGSDRGTKNIGDIWTLTVPESRQIK